MKRAFIITGPESTGSVYLSKIVSRAVGKDEVYGSWSGYEMNGEVGDDIVVIHRSLPSSGRFYDLRYYEDLLEDYKMFFIVPVRDGTIVDESKKRRFSYSVAEIKRHRHLSREIIEEILRSKHKAYIWSYEAFMHLDELYIQMLYFFLEVESDFFPNDLRDGNRKYIRTI